MPFSSQADPTLPPPPRKGLGSLSCVGIINLLKHSVTFWYSHTKNFFLVFFSFATHSYTGNWYLARFKYQQKSPENVDRFCTSPVGRFVPFYPGGAQALSHWDDGPTGTANSGLQTGAYSITLNQQTVPEPATIGIMGLGLLGLGFSRRKRIQ